MSTVIPKYRVNIDPHRWTPVKIEVFEDVLPFLEESRAAALYLILYDRVRHRPGAAIRATISDLCRWTKLNPRTVKKCAQELRTNGFIVRHKAGVLHSRSAHLTFASTAHG